MTKEGKAIISQIAEKIREAYGLDFPVDVRHLASELGVKITRLSDEYDIEFAPGRYAVRNGESFIEINPKIIDENEMRYLIARSLGDGMLHYHLLDEQTKKRNVHHFKKNKIHRGDDRSTEMVLENDEFAIELLMPSKEVAKRFDNTKSREEIISRMASDFGVSHATAKYRISEIAYPYLITKKELYQ